MRIIFDIAILHYDIFKISNISCGFEVLITMIIYCSVVQFFSIVIVESFILYRKGVKNCFPFFCRGVKISLRSVA